jgi:hypothetical protein
LDHDPQLGAVRAGDPEVKGSGRMRTVSVSGVALTSSPLPESNDELKPYVTPSEAVAPNDDMARGFTTDSRREGAERRVRTEESDAARVKAWRTSEPQCMERGRPGTRWWL